jgi:hypothetical protein
VDFSNERYVRLYTRDTDNWVVLSWQAKALFPLMLRKADRAGIIETRRGAKAIAVATGLPLEVVEVGLRDLLEAPEGEQPAVVQIETGYFLPNYIDAQEATQSDAQRARESRERRRERAKTIVTKRDAAAPEIPNVCVTERDTRSVRVVGVTERTPKSRNVLETSLYSNRTSLPSNQSTSTTTSDDDARRRLAIAANQAITVKFGEQTRPILAANGRTTEVVQVLAEQSIPIDFAEQSIVRQVQDSVSEPPRTLKYFLPGILSHWQEHEAATDAARSPRVSALTKGRSIDRVPPRGISPPVPDDGVKCRRCGTTALIEHQGRFTPAHLPSCPAYVEIPQQVSA